jgi:hypothetical protein
MSHRSKTTLCPNCGYHAEKNYCAQCGQETHLHTETFWGLVGHFIGHYFHYDSKFWKTLKALWLHPGSLTHAYWDKQRMRYIPPVSLYIFISAVFFIAFFTLGVSDEDLKLKTRDSYYNGDSLEVSEMPGLRINMRRSAADTAEKPAVGEEESTTEILQRATHTHTAQEAFSAILSTMVHGLPKLFFFLIPVMGLTLKFLFRKRREFFFVHHAVFSLHLHSFVFTLLLIPILIPYSPVKQLLVNLIFAGSIVYLIVAIKNAYGVSWKRATFNGLVVSSAYAFTFSVSVVLYLLAVLAFLLYV